MKVIINDCFGGYGIKRDVVLKLGYGKYDTYSDKLRTDERLINMLENGENVGGEYSNLIVATIPDDVTDWWIDEYDGLESLYYIIDGHREEWHSDEEDDEEDEE